VELLDRCFSKNPNSGLHASKPDAGCTYVLSTSGKQSLESAPRAMHISLLAAVCSCISVLACHDDDDVLDLADYCTVSTYTDSNGNTI
jgi:hypothetical protein